jgi:hypothetical protein
MTAILFLITNQNTRKGSKFIKYVPLTGFQPILAVFRQEGMGCLGIRLGTVHYYRCGPKT